MRIAYLVPEAVSPRSGVAEKVRAQCRAWREAGHTVALFTFVRRAPTAPPSASETVLGGDEEFVVAIPEGSPLTSELHRQAGLVRLGAAIRRWRATVAYLRFGLYGPGLELAFRAAPTVIEINSDDISEYAFRPAAMRIWNRATRVRTLSAARGIVFPTGELARARAFANEIRPAAVVSNGVDLARFPPSEPPANDRPLIVFAASTTAPWHGTDKVVRLAAGLPEFDFEVIGPEMLVESPGNLVWRGVLAPEEVRGRLRTADIGLGTLALHRKGMDEACPLKVREYLACGLPCVLAYSDTDFPEGAPFLLRLPNREDNVETALEAVAEFVRAQTGRRVAREAIAQLDQRVKEEQRLGFLARVATGGR